MLPLAVTLLVATPTPAVLSFSGDGSCGDERAIRDAITVRLGRDPFRDGAPGPRFDASITRHGSAWVSTLSVDGAAARRRTSSDCRELTQSLALAIALVLELAVPPAPPAAPAAPEPPPPVSWSVTAGGFASAGLSPHVTAGATLGLGLRASRFVLDVEGRVDVPAAIVLNGISFRSLPVVLTVAPGLAIGPVRLSAPFSFGGLFVRGSSEGSSVLALGGVQVSGAIRLATNWFLEPFVRVQAAFIRVTVLSGTAAVWTSWPLAGVAGLAVRCEFQ